MHSRSYRLPGSCGDALEDGRAGQHQPGLVPHPQPGAAWPPSAGLCSWPQPDTLGSLSPQQLPEPDSPWKRWCRADSRRRALNTLTIIKVYTNCLVLHHGWCIRKFVTETKKQLTVLSTAPWMLVVLPQKNTLHISEVRKYQNLRSLAKVKDTSVISILAQF